MCKAVAGGGVLPPAFAGKTPRGGPREAIEPRQERRNGPPGLAAGREGRLGGPGKGSRGDGGSGAGGRGTGPADGADRGATAGGEAGIHEVFGPEAFRRDAGAAGAVARTEKDAAADPQAGAGAAEGGAGGDR